MIGTLEIQSNIAFTDTGLIRTYYGQFALSLGKDSLYIFSKFNTDTFYGSLECQYQRGLTLLLVCACKSKREHNTKSFYYYYLLKKWVLNQ